jgi:hypothetical protein
MILHLQRSVVSIEEIQMAEHLLKQIEDTMLPLLKQIITSVIEIILGQTAMLHEFQDDIGEEILH